MPSLIGNKPNQVPSNGDLGTLAFQDASNVLVGNINATGVTTVQAGTAAAPAITTTGDTNTGIFFPAADTIAFTEGGTEVIRINSSGNLGVGTTTPSAKLDVVGNVSATTGFTQANTFNSASTFGFKNRLINGAMMIDQRNAGTSITPTTSGDWWGCDRWRFFINGASSKFSTQQSSIAPVGFSNSTLITSLSAYSVASTDNLTLAQIIEGFNTSDLNFGTANAQPVTISFWVRSSLTGAFGGSLANSASDRSYPFSYTISAANTWEQKSVTIAGDTSGTWIGATNGAGLRVRFNIGSGSNFLGTANAWASGNILAPTGSTSVVGTNGATFYITGIQLEKGSTATSFDYRPYGTELSLCYRYFQKFLGSSSYEALPSYVIAGSGTGVEGFLAYKGTMRSTPTLAISTLCLLDANGIFPISSASATNNGLDSMRITYSGISSLTQFRSYYVTANNSTSAFLTLSAEL